MWNYFRIGNRVLRTLTFMSLAVFIFKTFSVAKLVILLPAGSFLKAERGCLKNPEDKEKNPQIEKAKLS